jgi:hypothetical protein
MMDFPQAYLLSLAIETPILVLIFRDRYDWSRTVRNAVIATSVTLPFVWFAFPLLGLPWGLQTAISEVFALVIEATIYRLLFSKTGWREAFLASALCNAASFLIGLAL